MAERIGPMAPLLKLASTRLKVWGLLLKAQMLHLLIQKTRDWTTCFFLAPSFYYAIKYKWFRFIRSNQDICLNTLSLYAFNISLCFFPHFLLSHKKWNAARVALWSLVGCNPKPLMQNSLLNQRLQFSLLICFFSLQTILSFDIFISVLWPFSRMKMRCM